MTDTDTATFKDWQIFGNDRDAHQFCCDCCNAHCLGVEARLFSDAHREPLYVFTHNDVRYVTDQYVAIRADLIDSAHGIDVTAYAAAISWRIPDSRPGLSTAYLGALYMHLLDEAGLDICEGESHAKRQHIYRRDEHVGWLMPTRGDNGLTLTDLPALREIAEALPVAELDHPITTAARLLMWERRRKTQETR